MEVKREEERLGIVILRNVALILGCLLLVEGIGFQVASAMWLVLMSLKESL